MTSRTTNIKKAREWRRRVEGRALLKKKRAAVLTSTGEGREKGRGGDMQEDDLEQLGAAVNTFIQFPRLTTES